MLTKKLAATGGEILVKGKSVRTEFSDVKRDIGYCPQYDGFVGSMTGRELLVMFANLRSIPTASIPTVVDEFIEQLNLTDHADRLAGTFAEALLYQTRIG